MTSEALSAIVGVVKEVLLQSAFAQVPCWLAPD